MQLRKNPTPSEIIVRDKLTELGVDFIFQKGFYKGDYHCIVDFYLPKPLKICIEIDGLIHETENQNARDIRKSAYLIARGFKVIRIKNSDVSKYDFTEFL